MSTICNCILCYVCTTQKHPLPPHPPLSSLTTFFLLLLLQGHLHILGAESYWQSTPSSTCALSDGTVTGAVFTIGSSALCYLQGTALYTLSVPQPCVTYKELPCTHYRFLSLVLHTRNCPVHTIGSSALCYIKGTALYTLSAPQPCVTSKELPCTHYRLLSLVLDRHGRHLGPTSSHVLAPIKSRSSFPRGRSRASQSIDASIRLQHRRSRRKRNY